MPNILITGANRGLGLEMVRQYVQHPEVFVFATCRDPQAAADLQNLADQNPKRLSIHQLNVVDDLSRAQIVQEIAAKTAALDVLINNAGIHPRGVQSFEAITPQTLHDVFEVNTAAPLMLVKSLLDLLHSGENPRVINISSQVGSLEWKKSGGSYAYAVSKAGLNMITRCLAADLQEYGITVISVHPGWVQTDMGGIGAPLSVKEAVSSILPLIDRLSAKDSGKFFRWEGTIHPW